MKRTIGIDITQNYINIAQLRYSRGKLFLERAYVQQLPEDMQLEKIPSEEIQKAMKEGDFDKKAPVIVSMPYGEVFFHNFITEISSDKDIEQLLKFELEDDFPIHFDDLVVDICSCRELNEHEREFLVGAVRRSRLQDWIKKIHLARMGCSIVTAEACALHAAAELNQELNYKSPSLIIFVDGYRIIMAVCQEHSLISVRYIRNNKTTNTIESTLLREIKLTLRALFSTGIPAPSKILLTGSNKVVQNLFESLKKEVDTKIEILNPLSKIEHLPQQGNNDKIVIALGLALIGLDQKSNILNFLSVDQARADQTIKTKRNALVFGFLILTLGVLFFMNLFVQLNALEKENQLLEQEIREVFVQTLPEETRIVNELAQLDDEYKVLENEYNTIATEILSKVSSLQILMHISERITPDQNIGISSISMTAESVLLSGIATSFEAVDDVVDILRQIPEFNSINIQNVDLDPINNQVFFNLLINISLI